MPPSTSRVLRCLLVAVTWGLIAAPTLAEDAISGDQAMTVIVTAVRGMVQVRASENDPWIPAKPGQKLTQGAEFRTGPRSAVEFQIPPDQTCVLDRLGTMKVLAAIRHGNKVKTELGMKYGRTRYNIAAGGDLEHESTIRSPSATLAVRGTDVTFADEMGFPAMAQWNAVGFDQARHDSQAQLTNNDTGQTQTFGGGDSNSSTNTRARNAGRAAIKTTVTGYTRDQTTTEWQTTTTTGGSTFGGQTLGGEQQNQQQRDIGRRQAFDNPREYRKLDGKLEIRLTWNDNRTDLDLFTQTKLTTGATERIASSSPPDDPIPFITPPPIRQIPARSAVFSGGAIVQTSAGSANPATGQTFTEVIRFDKNGKHPVIPAGYIGVRQVNHTGPLPGQGGGQQPTAFTITVLVDGVQRSQTTGTLTQGQADIHEFNTTDGIASH